MEVLGINMVHVVWLLVELLEVEVLNSNSIFSCLLNMESVGNESQVWVHEFDEIGDDSLDLVSWVKGQLDPTALSSLSDVVFEWSAHSSLVEESTIDHFV